MVLPTTRLSVSSSNLYGYFPSASSDNSLSELYPSPRSSSITIQALLIPTVGVGEPSSKSYSQGDRPAVSHSILVQTPHVYPNLATLAVLVQCYDEFGHSDVPSARLSISASLTDATTQSLSSYAMRGPSGASYTRRYHTTIPSSWFSAASESGAVASISTSLSGGGTHTASLVVYGTPSWFSERLSSAGIAAYMTSNTAGTTPAQTMRVGSTFYLQLYAHTGGEDMSSFEVKIVEDNSVCQVKRMRVSISGYTCTPEAAYKHAFISTLHAHVLAHMCVCIIKLLRERCAS